MSPGWQSNALQIESKVLKRIAFDFPVFKIERFDNVKSTLSESSFSEIFRFAIITSKFTIIGIAQIVKSFSDLISMAFCKSFSNIAAAVATTIETKVVTIQIARKPAGSSSRLWNILIYSPAVTIKILSPIALYFILFKALTDFDENTLFCPM